MIININSNISHLHAVCALFLSEIVELLLIYLVNSSLAINTQSIKVFLSGSKESIDSTACRCEVNVDFFSRRVGGDLLILVRN